MRAALLSLAWLLLPLVASALPPPERVRFDSLDRVSGRPVPVEALLFVPEGAAPAAGRPAVVGLHGCNGLYAAGEGPEERLSVRFAQQAETWLAQGYAVLLPDSFKTRGMRDVCTVRLADRRVTPAQRRLDAVGALDWLARQADIDPGRIALVGWSHGGSTVLATLNEADGRIASWRARHDAPPFFRTAVAFYPGCTESLQDRRWRPAAPLAILIGAADDWTPAAPCESLGTRGREAHWPLDVVVYPDAYHAFDAPSGTVRLRKDVPNGVRPGAGVHVGPHPQAREDANARLAAILERSIGR